MKTMTIWVALAALGTAGHALGQGGFDGPDDKRRATVAEAAALSDDTRVIVVGSIVRALGDEKYEFRDDTGVLRVEIDDDDWDGLRVTPEDRLELEGEIEQDSDGPELDVDAVRRAD